MQDPVGPAAVLTERLLIERAGEIAYAGENSFVLNPYLSGTAPDPRARDWWRGWDRKRQAERRERDAEAEAAKRARIAEFKKLKRRAA